ncbi:hypothetical protein K437DRAFT_259423 [Tilletiaria anomala UBC 951]|uniref:Uncharacterized protein n=1 Tax=Tilletiaria anomala (strain ATCC 24038 / CBS 436.72 / UBC 951) TaxID=1037660 RepID=A0A066VI39_TILAU|nr:uncharacterized protein K437DRAFT_259423 [Tilletiaria anomala UBC 951]KDN38384.1 hypothetical protein K437DRAFT_259423 [Tilletiaria anomala UBC 951]
MQVEATLTLIQDPQSLLLKGGVITPALLGKRYTERLVQNAGFKIETRSVGGGDDDEGSKKFK